MTSDNWAQRLLDQGYPVPNRTGIRRLLMEVERCFDALGCEGDDPAVQAPPRGATVGPWQLNKNLCQRLVVLEKVCNQVQSELARLTLPNAQGDTQLTVLRHFLVSDDLARNGMFADAAMNMAEALTLSNLSPEMRCLIHFRMVKYLRRTGEFAGAREHLEEINRLIPGLGAPMHSHFQTELFVQSWRLRYDDVGKPEMYTARKAPSARADVNFRSSTVDSRLMWQQLNLWASEWRRQMELGDLKVVQAAFNHSKAGYEAAVFWALVSEDALNAMNVIANMGYLLHLSSQKHLADLALDALNWLLLSQAYIERFEWPEESLWDYVYLAELYLSSPSIRQHLEANRAYFMNALTPDKDAFYVHAITLGISLKEPRQLADIYQLYIQYLMSVGRVDLAQAQQPLLDELLERHPGLRRQLNVASRQKTKATAATSQ